MRVAVVGILALCGAAAPAAAQVAPNRATRYLFQTDVRDARAIWVNPGGTAVTPSASVYGDVTVEGPDAGMRLAQITAGFASRGLTFGYQYDDFDVGVGHTYRLGLAGATSGFAIGAAAAYYRGGTSDWGYDIGAVFLGAGRGIVLGATAANIGEPTVRGVRQDFAFLPGVTVTPFGPAIELSAQARFADAGDGYSAGARWRLAGQRLVLSARLDMDGDLRSTGVVFGLAIGGQDQAGLVVTTPRDLSSIEATSLYGVAARPMGGR
jgi:hypothetical protein